jgi:gliding motility-associated-like protein
MIKCLRNLFFIISLSFCLVPMKGYSTHIVGGEMNYRYLGNNRYEIRLTVYRDCRHGIPPFDFPASIGVFDTANHLVNVPYHFTGLYPQPPNQTAYFNDSLVNNLNYGILIMPTDSEAIPNIINAPCVIPPVDICYHVCHYVDTITLPFIPGGYKLVYMRCCRNAAIQNIVNPGGTGATYIMNIPDSSVVVNNSNPIFNNLPPTFICIDIPFTFDHSAHDLDGDSLVYRLCVPTDGPDSAGSSACFHSNTCCQTQAQPCSVEPQPPFDPTYISITWQNPYSIANLLGGVPMAIDSVTGLLTATPNTIGDFVYAVCVSEYRNGVYLDMTKRDYQINVVNCALVTVASIESPLITCGSDFAQFQNNSSGASSYHWDFGNGNLTNDTSNLTNPGYTYPDTGTYNVELIAYSSFSSACNDTSYGVVDILPKFPAGFKYSIQPCTNTVTFTDTSSSIDGPPNKWYWTFGDTTAADSTIQDPTHIYSRTGGTDTVTLIVRSGRGCIDTIKEEVTFPSLVTTTFADTIVCANKCNGVAESQSIGGTSPYTYRWSTIPIQTTATATGLCPGIYYVTTTDAQGCTTVDSVTVRNSIGTDSIFITAQPDTIFSFQTTQLTVQPSSGYTYTWSPSTGLNSTSIYNPTATPTQTTTYYVTLEDANGCRAISDSIQVVVLTLHCNDEDIYVPNAFTPDANGHNDILYVRSRGITGLYFAIYNRWGEKVFETNDITKGWDGTYKGAKCDPDVFVYYLNATCLTGLTYFKKGNITLLK